MDDDDRKAAHQRGEDHITKDLGGCEDADTVDTLVGINAALTRGAITGGALLALLGARHPTPDWAQPVHRPDDELEVDDSGYFSEGEDGGWMLGWLWCPNPNINEDEED
jgi:hypothetical protein